MQKELDAAGSPLKIQIVGINHVDKASGNDGMCQGRDLPWLQDDASNVWELWVHAYRDVVILDAQNVVMERYNLTDHPLDDPANYAALKSKLTAAAR